MQIKPKLHKLWRITLCLGKLHLSVFLWVFWPERVVPPLVIAFEQQSLECFVIATLRTNRVLRADRKADVNQTSQQSVFSPIGACIRIWCTAGAVERRSQMFVYRPFRFSLSIPKACSQATKTLFTTPYRSTSRNEFKRRFSHFLATFRATIGSLSQEQRFARARKDSRWRRIYQKLRAN